MNKRTFGFSVGGDLFDIGKLNTEISDLMIGSRNKQQTKPNGDFYETNSAWFAVDSVSHAIEAIDNVIHSQENGAVDFIDLDLTYAYAGQCNLEFSPEEIKEIARVGASVLISCYADDEENNDR
jgi:hypothetical protein